MHIPTARGAGAAGMPGDATIASAATVAEPEPLPSPSRENRVGAGTWLGAATRFSERSRSRLRHQQLSGSELSSGVEPTVSRRNSGVLRPTSAEPTSEGVFPEWRDGRAMVLRGRTTSVRQIADARASLATSTSGYAGGVSRGSDMIWHFPLDLTEGIEWRLMCRSAEAMVSECLGRLPTVSR